MLIEKNNKVKFYVLSIIIWFSLGIMFINVNSMFYLIMYMYLEYVFYVLSYYVKVWLYLNVGGLNIV